VLHATSETHTLDRRGTGRPRRRDRRHRRLLRRRRRRRVL